MKENIKKSIHQIRKKSERTSEDYEAEIKILKNNLKEANNIIVRADWDCDYILQKKCGFSEYLKKYNIQGIEE